MEREIILNRFYIIIISVYTSLNNPRQLITANDDALFKIWLVILYYD